MHWDQIEGNWHLFKTNIRLNWEKITDEQLASIAGDRSHLVSKIQVMYGIDSEQAEQQLSDWQNNQINIDGHFYQSNPSLKIV